MHSARAPALMLRRLARLFCFELPKELLENPPAMPNTLFFTKLPNKKLTLVEADQRDFAQMLRDECPGDLASFLENRKHIVSAAQFLDGQGVIDHDFNIIKPLAYVDQKIRPAANQFLIETDRLDGDQLNAMLKRKMRRSPVDFYDMSDQLSSYRLFNVEKTYDCAADMRGRLHKSFYPEASARSRRSPGPRCSEPDEFLDICAFHPRTHRLWLSIYSADPRLDLLTPGIESRPEVFYFALRCLHGVPEHTECFDRTPREVQLERLELLGNSHAYRGREQVEKEARRSRVKFAILAHSQLPVFGECVGFPLALVDTQFQAPAKLRVVRGDGSEPVSVLRTVHNVALVVVEEGFGEQRFEAGGVHFHLFEPQGLWPDERAEIEREAANS